MKLIISASEYMRKAPVAKVGFSSEDQLVVVFQDGETWKLTQELEPISFFKVDTAVPGVVAISPNGKWVAVAPGCEVVWVNTENNRKSTLVFHQIVTQVVFSPTGQFLAVGLSNGRVYIRDVFSDKGLGFIEHGPDAGAVTAIAISEAINENDHIVATALTAPNGLYLWNLSDRSSSFVLRSHIPIPHEEWWWITHLAFTKGNSSLIYVFPDKISLISLDGSARQEIEVDNCISFALSSSLFAIGTMGGYIQLRALDGTLLYETPAHASRVLHLAFSKDGNRLVSSDARHIKVWEINE